LGQKPTLVIKYNLRLTVISGNKVFICIFLDIVFNG